MKVTEYEIKGLTYAPEGGYIERVVIVNGPLYHGSRSKSLGPGDEIRPGVRTNSWGDEGDRSQYVHCTTRLDVATEYAERAGGSVYEVEPVGDMKFGLGGEEFKSESPFRIVRKLNIDGPLAVRVPGLREG